MITSISQLFREWFAIVFAGLFSLAIGEILIRIATGRWTFLPAIQREPLTYLAIISIAAAVGLAVRRFRTIGAD